MKLFHKESVRSKLQRSKVNVFGESTEKLDKDGELPFGWIAHNMDFTQKIQDEYGHFLNNWVATRRKADAAQYSALESLILYIQDAQKMCSSKGECFEKWFTDCIADEKCLEKRKKTLQNWKKC